MQTRFLKYILPKVYFLFCLYSISQTSAQNTILESGIDKLNLIGCSLQNGMINMNGDGDFQTNKAIFCSETTLEEIDVIFEIKVLAFDTNGSCSFAIGKQSWLAGTMVEFNSQVTASEIKVYRLDNSASTQVKQFTLPFSISPGKTYIFRISKRIQNLSIEINSDDDYYYNDSLYYPVPYFGCMWGTPFIACSNGEIDVTDFTLSTSFNTSPRLAVWGDSFIEGNSLPNIQNRYISLVQDSIGFQNTAIMGRGRESSTTLDSRFSKETQWFKGSEYALLAIGVNDFNFTTWKNNILKDIDTLKKYNIIPIVATLTPRFDRVSFIQHANNWIRNEYNGAYVDLSKAVSANQLNWLPGNGINDSIHPSVQGHLSMFERIKQDAPYLFRKDNAFSIDYINETTNEAIGDKLKYSTNFNFVINEFGNNSTIPITPGATVYFRDTASHGNANSLYGIVSAPSRPVPPASMANTSSGIFDWIFNSNYTSILDYEYSIDDGIKWRTCLKKPIIDLGSLEIQIRVKATSLHFKSVPLHLRDTIPIAGVVNIRVYPNPVNDILTIENITEETMLAINSVDGRVIKTILLSNAVNTINTDDLKSGFYILTLVSKSLSVNYKIFKS